ncbi:hypothetical protein PROFUN_16015, partial [Planoprotostelium fungivorum]
CITGIEGFAEFSLTGASVKKGSKHHTCVPHPKDEISGPIDFSITISENVTLHVIVSSGLLEANSDQITAKDIMVLKIEASPVQICNLEHGGFYRFHVVNPHESLQWPSLKPHSDGGFEKNNLVLMSGELIFKNPMMPTQVHLALTELEGQMSMALLSDHCRDSFSFAAVCRIGVVSVIVISGGVLVDCWPLGNKFDCSLTPSLPMDRGLFRYWCRDDHRRKSEKQTTNNTRRESNQLTDSVSQGWTASI